MRAALAFVVWTWAAACGNKTQPTTGPGSAIVAAEAGMTTDSNGPPDTANAGITPDADASTSTVSTTTPIELNITEGKPQSLPDGTTVDVSKLMYAHMKDSKNLSAARVTLVRGADRIELDLHTRHDPAHPPAWVAGLGWEVQLVFADPYRQPGNASLRIRKAP